MIAGLLSFLPLPVSMHDPWFTTLATPHLFTALPGLPALCSCLLDTFAPILMTVNLTL